MKAPVLILSDLHLGHSASRIDEIGRLRPLLEGAATVIFNGDTWQELARSYRERSAEMLGDLRQLCAELGAEPVFVSGNHDPGWPGRGWAELAGGRVLVTHGDAVYREGSPWSREAFERAPAVRELWERHARANEDPAERIRLAREVAVALRAASYPRGRSLLSRAMDALTPPRRAWEIAKVWLRQPDEVARFAARYFPQAEVVAVGHFHRSGVWRRGDRLVLNTGAFVRPHAARWVEWRDGRLEIGAVIEGGRIRRGPGRVVWDAGAETNLAPRRDP